MPNNWKQRRTPIFKNKFLIQEQYSYNNLGMFNWNKGRFQEALNWFFKALKLAEKLKKKGIKIIGTTYENMDLAEDRGRFSDLLKDLGIPYPKYGTAVDCDEALVVANKVGYPVLVRPSYVLGGQSMKIVKDPSLVE